MNNENITATTGEEQNQQKGPVFFSEVVPLEDQNIVSEFELEEARTSAPHVVLWENNGCTGDRRRITRDYPTLRGVFHDEARSLTFYGPRNSSVTVYDSSNYGRNDDFAIVWKTDDDPVCVNSFETTSPRKWLRQRGYYIWYSGGTNLDGKVSSIRFGKWW